MSRKVVAQFHGPLFQELRVIQKTTFLEALNVGKELLLNGKLNQQVENQEDSTSRRKEMCRILNSSKMKAKVMSCLADPLGAPLHGPLATPQIATGAPLHGPLSNPLGAPLTPPLSYCWQTHLSLPSHFTNHLAVTLDRQPDLVALDH